MLKQKFAFNPIVKTNSVAVKQMTLPFCFKYFIFFINQNLFASSILFHLQHPFIENTNIIFSSFYLAKNELSTVERIILVFFSSAITFLRFLRTFKCILMQVIPQSACSFGCSHKKLLKNVDTLIIRFSTISFVSFPHTSWT